MYGLTSSNIETLEKCDRFLFRKIFNCPVSTPIESFYLETGTMPIRFIIIGRRLLFYWSILNKSENELAKQVLLTQQISPVKNDWCSTVEEDLRSLNIDMHQDTIAAMKKTTFKKLVQSKLRETAFAYLLELKRKHSKSANLTASTQIQKYLSSCDLTTKENKYFSACALEHLIARQIIRMGMIHLPVISVAILMNRNTLFSALKINLKLTYLM